VALDAFISDIKRSLAYAKMMIMGMTHNDDDDQYDDDCIFDSLLARHNLPQGDATDRPSLRFSPSCHSPSRKSLADSRSA